MLEVSNENGNRDITNKGRVGALSFDIERPATAFFLLGPSTKVWTDQIMLILGAKSPSGTHLQA